MRRCPRCQQAEPDWLIVVGRAYAAIAAAWLDVVLIRVLIRWATA